MLLRRMDSFSMKRLSGQDAFYLSLENSRWPQHTAGLIILDPSATGTFDLDTLRNHLEGRLRYLPQWRRRVQQVPLRLDRPLWVDDPGFSLKAHVRRAAVPSPGGPRELGTLIGDLLAHPMDRSRPLWQAWYLEGLEGNRVAVLVKQHHSMVDGIAGAGLADVICDIEERPARPPIEVPEDRSNPKRSSLELLARGVVSALQSPPEVVKLALQTVGDAVTVIRNQRRDDPPPRPLSAPRTSLNGTIGRRRDFAYGTLALDDVKRVKNHFDVTVNDVILAVISGALRRYLVERGELPEKSLLATVPMSTRGPDDAERGNAVYAMVASLATDIEDPIARLAKVHRNMNIAKELAEPHKHKDRVGVTDVAPPFLFTLLFRTVQASNLEASGPVFTNLIISTVPGPQFTLYLAGARIEHMIPVAPLSMGMGINATAFSYLNSVDIGMQVDPDLVEEPWVMTGFVQQELDRLVAETGRKKRPRVRR